VRGARAGAQLQLDQGWQERKGYPPAVEADRTNVGRVGRPADRG
jgi:hypothetical protein